MGMTFGFSYVGLIFLLMLFLPNMLWTRHKPQGYDQVAAKEPRGLLALERVGEAAVTCAAVIFSDFNLRPWKAWSWWLVGAGALMVLYEIWWIRYFCGEKTLADFYSSLLGIPVAGATLPVAAFFLLAVYGKNPVLGVADIILGIGHIGIHLIDKRKAA